MSKSVFEVDQDHDRVVVWEAGTGHYLKCLSVDDAKRITEQLRAIEREFHKNKIVQGVASVVAYGEDMTPYEYIRRVFKTYSCGVGKFLGYEVTENCITRPTSEFW